MVKKIFHYSLICFMLSFANGLAQEVGIGQWRDHLPYRSAISVASDGNRVFAATASSLFYFNKSDNSINRLNRISGLNDIGISRIAYHKSHNTLLIAYSNTNIDLIKGNVIINMPDILTSSAITPERKFIHNILFVGKYAYLSCGFGIVVIDLEREEVSDTYYIGPDGTPLNVYGLTHDDTRFYAATESGVYSALRDDPNLAYFEAWSKDNTLPAPNGVYNHIAFNAGILFVNKYSDQWAADSIFMFRDNEWIHDTSIFDNSNKVFALKTVNNILYVVQRYSIHGFDAELNTVALIWTYFTGGCFPRDMDIDNSGLWIADEQSGLVFQESYEKFVNYYPNGPKTPEVFSMFMQDEDLWVATGGRDLSWTNNWNRGRIHSMRNDTWETIDQGSPGAAALDTIYDLVCIISNPQNPNQVFAGSWFLGLTELVNNQFTTLYNPENSSLEYRISEGPPVCKIGGLAYDDAGNLWITNSGANNILSVMIADGSVTDWRSFYLGSQSTGKEIGELIIDSYGKKWILWRQGHLIVFDDNGTPKNPADDQVKHLSSSVGNGNIPGTKVFGIAEDNDGRMWIGTDEGIAVIYSPENVFSQFSFDAQRILIPRNDGTGLADILLEFETITAIAVDGANNKWIGTDRSGVYQLSPDGLGELNHFTTENSPLLSNNITDIVINHKSGEVFFGTANGIISYKSTATGGGETNNDVYAYPNPVRPGYSGPIAVKGLVNNANFKITDISGSLVYSGRADGGQANWNGNNFNGRRVQSGVYLVFVTDDEGIEKMVTKILFMN
jgi:hypothetical protein